MSHQPIKLLSDQVANKISAGEVVERPASVIKELIENAIDAKAKRIDIVVTMGGKKSMVVSDNGIGMNRHDALLCVERHATSKIRDVDEIDGIRTLGFRGEALAAISSVSRFLLITRPTEELHGTEIEMAAGKIQDVRETGAPPGTSIQVRQLFFNVPARRKFLKSEQTEMAHIRKSFQLYALAWSNISWSLTVDQRKVKNLPHVHSFEDRLMDLYDREFVKSLRNIKAEYGGFGIQGFAALPQISRKDRQEQFIFVNRRPVFSPVLSRAITEAYHGLISRDRHPILFLFLSMEPGSVDVNVHPAKKEVRFRNANAVRDAVISAIRQGLSNPVAQKNADSIPVTQSTTKASSFSAPRVFQYPSMPLVSQVAIESLDKEELITSTLVQPPEAKAPWVWCKVLGQVGGRFALLETDEGVVIMNPRAAHERVLFERFMDEMEASQVKSQRLLQAETVELGMEDARKAQHYLKVLQKTGWEISPFGDTSFMVEALPALLGNQSPQTLLSEILCNLEEAGVKAGTQKMAAQKLARTVCGLAVNRKQTLSIAEIEQLVKDLAETRMPYTCPKGCPTLIFMGYNELNRKFGL